MTPTNETPEQRRERLRKQYESETGKKWMDNPVCRGETGYASKMLCIFKHIKQ